MTEQALIRRDDRGVILRYYPDRLMPHHLQRKRHPADRQRTAIVKAKRECQTLAIIVDHLEDLSSVGRTRICDALAVIESALELATPADTI